jgi:polysaccharide biosynthesis protein PelF
LKSNRTENVADVCLIVEGAYPYVSGGVSTWVHDLIISLAPMTFHVVALRADNSPCKSRYEVPANLIGLTNIVLQPNQRKHSKNKEAKALMAEIEQPLQALLNKGNGDHFKRLVDVLRKHQDWITRDSLMDSDDTFELIQRMYQSLVPNSSFLQFFWSWRSLVGGLFAILTAEIPNAKVYHAISTGYAGLLMARAALESGRSGLLTEHGIYTNERRIEILMAEWLSDRSAGSLEIESKQRGLRDVWIDAFIGYSRTCYQFSEKIITLYDGNQKMQLRDGAVAERMEIIPNGVDTHFFSNLAKASRPSGLTIALIGRVVAIKDVKTYIRAVAILRESIPQIRALVLGPTDEDPNYFQECRDMVSHLGLKSTVEFLGQVKVYDFLPMIDVVVLTSISEAQPLVLLEAGAAAIPAVATDVGACREMIEGTTNESPPLGCGGIVTPLANPKAIAFALQKLLSDEQLRTSYGKTMQARTINYYAKEKVYSRYQQIYQSYLRKEPIISSKFSGDISTSQTQPMEIN